MVGPVGSRRQFKVIKFIGKGSFGSVYRVRRLSDGLDYAMKQINVTQMNSQEKKKAINEIRILASVASCPYLVRFYEAFIENDTLYIVTDYAAQGDLLSAIKKHYKRRTHFPERQTWSYLIQLCLGMQYLHRHKILHRDLKSANLFVTDDGVLKIGDFGISKLLKPPEMFAKTQIGSPYYVSPEMWKNKPYNSKTDMWAIGCFLYELVALHPPFQANSLDKLAARIMAGQYEPLPRHCSPELAAIIRRLLIVDTKQRPSCTDILQTAAVQSRMHLLPKVDDEGYGFGPPGTDDEMMFTKVDLLRNIATPKKPKDMRKYLPRARYGDFRAAEASARGSPAMTEPGSTRPAPPAIGPSAAYTDPTPAGEGSAFPGIKPSAPRLEMRRRPGASPKQIKIGSRHEDSTTPYMPHAPWQRGAPTGRSDRPSERGMRMRGQKKHYFAGLSERHRERGGQRMPRSLAGRAAANMYGQYDSGGGMGGRGEPPDFSVDSQRSNRHPMQSNRYGAPSSRYNRDDAPSGRHVPPTGRSGWDQGMSERGHPTERAMLPEPAVPFNVPLQRPTHEHPDSFGLDERDAGEVRAGGLGDDVLAAGIPGLSMGGVGQETPPMH